MYRWRGLKDIKGIHLSTVDEKCCKIFFSNLHIIVVHEGFNRKMKGKMQQEEKLSMVDWKTTCIENKSQLISSLAMQALHLETTLG